MRFRYALVLLLTYSAPAMAQHAEKRFESARDSVVSGRGAWTPIRVAKWSTLLASTSAAAYGFAQNRTADGDYQEIERLCLATSSSCDRTPGSDAYADVALETRYQAVVRRDDRAQVALLAGQVGLAASMLLFILDLPNGSGPKDIPYEPKPLRVGFTADQVQLSWRIRVR